MTQPIDIRRAGGPRPLLLDVYSCSGGGVMSEHLHTALRLVASGLPALPLRKGKVPFGNCRACAKNACGGRPNMKTPGRCPCPSPCHGWAAATTDPRIINSPTWRRAWRDAAAVAYHPGGAGLTVVDLDNAEAIAWARASLPATRTVPTTRGEHWLYKGVMQSANAVRPGVDIKSTMAYARWLGPGTGPITALPDVVRGLAVKEPTALRPAAITVPALAGGGECPHRTPAYLDRGIAMAEQRITEASSAVHATVYRTFLAVLSTHGRCGCLTEAHISRLFTAAQTKGESARHCTDAWTNARTRLGL
ncbi:bifunctional DNA primase/polymerase [Streptomyces sp. NBC_01410]|uniref:bifunctional DNA primase/polymerase n=1 Tax=Streptomyces sp. NBC_01410 TaxID=2903856 RepID=UPI003864B89E